MKRIMLILIAVAGIGVMFSSCKKSASQSIITYQNNTYTPVSIVVNGVGKTIAPGGSVLYIANEGTEAIVTASTSGTYGGATITWSFTDYFPGIGGDNMTEPLDVSASYFYLEVINAYSAPVAFLTVNLGLTSQTDEFMDIPNNGNAYGIGYYLAFPNTVIKAKYTNNDSLIIRSIAIPYKPDASYTANVY